MFRRRPTPVVELPLTDQDVTAIFGALADIRHLTHGVWEVIVGDEDGEEETES